MRDSPPEVIYSAAEGVTDVDAVCLPAQPVECCIVAAAVSAEGELANLSLCVVGVVDAHEGCAQTEGWIVDNLQCMVYYCIAHLFVHV